MSKRAAGSGCAWSVRGRTDSSAREGHPDSARPRTGKAGAAFTHTRIEVISSLGANVWLNALPDQERILIRNRCEPVILSQDQIITKPGARIRDIYFPAGSIFLRTAQAKPSGTIGVDLIGNEGMVGASLALGVDISPLQVSVAGAGKALHMGSPDFRDLLRAFPMLERQLKLYLYLQLRQAQQTIACAVFHTVDKRLAYWLLMLHDRALMDRIHLTHDRLASMLGVRRSGVSTAAGLLQRRKVISYSRGHIVILNRQELEKAACGCYRKGRTTAKQVVTAHTREGDAGIADTRQERNARSAVFARE